MTPALRILLVEDDEPFRRAIYLLLQKKPEFEVFEASDGLEAIRKAKQLQPDLVLFDIGLPKLNGIESARRVPRQVPHAKVLFLSQESGAELILETFRLGALGYVHKQNALRDLFAAIDSVLCGEPFVSSDLEFGQGSDVLSRNQPVNIAGPAEIEKTEERRIALHRHSGIFGRCDHL